MRIPTLNNHNSYNDLATAGGPQRVDALQHCSDSHLLLSRCHRAYVVLFSLGRVMGSTLKRILQWDESFGCWKGFVGYILQLYPGGPLLIGVYWGELITTLMRPSRLNPT